MPCARIHEAVVLELNKDYNYNVELLRIGTIAPDSWRNVDDGVKDKYLSHFWNFRIKDGQANDYQEFYLKYYNHINNPFYFGYLIHLMVDQYWKTNIDPKYRMISSGIKGYKLKNGKFHDDENYWGYYDSLKMEKQIAKIYQLDKLSINQEEYNFECHIDELDLNGLFGSNGSINYLNTKVMSCDIVEESEIYDIDCVIKDIKETTEFIKKELERLKKVKREYDKKIKIAVDIDDTILCTKELEEYYWNEFINSNPDIDPNKEYKWGDPELAKFWMLYREKMAFGNVKPYVQESLRILLDNNFQVDLLSARPVDKYANLKKQMIDYFEANDIIYNYINLGFYSKKEFLKEHNYDILIDNDMKYIKEAESVGVIPILYGDDPNYDGLQTDDWKDIPILVKKCVKSR